MSDPEASTSYSLSARILTTSILSLTFVVLLLLVLHLYARCILRTSTTRPQISLFRISSDSQVAPRASTGVDRSVIDLIPTFAYEKEGKDGNSSGAECAICLSGVDEEEMVRVLPNCKHLFHVDCIDMWLESHCTCPVCRAAVEVGGESGLVSRLGSSLRRLMSRDRSGRRAVLQDGSADLERQ